MPTPAIRRPAPCLALALLATATFAGLLHAGEPATPADSSRLARATATNPAAGNAPIPPPESPGVCTSIDLFGRTADEWDETAAGRRRLEAAKTKPFEMRFTAVDGRQVDVASLRGKVVLVDFWAL